MPPYVPRHSELGRPLGGPDYGPAWHHLEGNDVDDPENPPWNTFPRFLRWWDRHWPTLDHAQATRDAGCISVGWESFTGANVIARFSGRPETRFGTGLREVELIVEPFFFDLTGWGPMTEMDVWASMRQVPCAKVLNWHLLLFYAKYREAGRGHPWIWRAIYDELVELEGQLGRQLEGP